MHEYAIVQNLLERVRVEAEAHHAASVCRVFVRVGELSGVVPELLATAFEMCREGTLCATAELELRVVPTRWTCPACALDLDPAGLKRCPTCAGPARLAAGHELFLDRVEMEVPDV